MRPAVKEQVQSLGARFVELPLESTDAEDKGGYAKAQDEAFYRRQREMMIKVVAANVVMDVLDRAIQVHGSLGMSDDTPLAAM